MDRITRDELWVGLAILLAGRSTCERKHVGCVVTVEGRAVATGYNGAPSKMEHCTTHGCDTDESGACIRTVHAEAATISWAARKGVALEGGTLYCTLSPCKSCAKLIINAGIQRVVFVERYLTAPDGVALMEQAGIKCLQSS